VVTRPEPKNTEACAEIRARGGTPLPFPCVKIRPLPPEEWAPGWLETIADSRWLVFTSAHGVTSFITGFLASGGDLRLFGKHKFAVIGPATAKALTLRGFVPDCMPLLFTGERLGEVLTEQIARGEKVLLVRALRNAEGLSEVLNKKAVPFRELAVYETIPVEGSPIVRRIISEGRFDSVLFASPSAVSAFAAAFSLPNSPAIVPEKLPIKALCIGESAAARARNFGMEVQMYGFS
jgi:uroporphyrinogen III methyltransferase/synthase